MPTTQLRLVTPTQRRPIRGPVADERVINLAAPPTSAYCLRSVRPHAGSASDDRSCTS